MSEMTDPESRLRLRLYAATQAGMTGDESDAEWRPWIDLLRSDERDVLMRQGLEELMRVWMGSLLPSRRSSLKRAGPQAVAEAFVADLLAARSRRPS